MHGLKSAIDRGADAWARSLPGRVLDRYVSRSGPLLANGLAYGLLFAFFAGVWIAVSVGSARVFAHFGLRPSPWR